MALARTHGVLRHQLRQQLRVSGAAAPLPAAAAAIPCSAAAGTARTTGCRRGLERIVREVLREDHAGALWLVGTCVRSSIVLVSTRVTFARQVPRKRELGFVGYGKDHVLLVSLIGVAAARLTCVHL